MCVCGSDSTTPCLQVANPSVQEGVVGEIDTVNFEASKETLQTMLDGLGAGTVVASYLKRVYLALCWRADTDTSWVGVNTSQGRSASSLARSEAVDLQLLLRKHSVDLCHRHHMTDVVALSGLVRFRCN